ncbi:hypothetical protein N597_04035 [Streptococcus ilei]|nr:hypothetical protein N597_04035 [Streptococcus ilei]
MKAEKVYFTGKIRTNKKSLTIKIYILAKFLYNRVIK